MTTLSELLEAAEHDLALANRRTAFPDDQMYSADEVFARLVDVLRVLVGRSESGDTGGVIEYGWVVPPGVEREFGYQVEIDEPSVINALKAKATAELPPGTRFEIRRAIPWNYGRSKGIGWFSSKAMAGDRAWDVWAPGYVADGGYFLVERCVTLPSAQSQSPRTSPISPTKTWDQSQDCPKERE